MDILTITAMIIKPKENTLGMITMDMITMVMIMDMIMEMLKIRLRPIS